MSGSNNVKESELHAIFVLGIHLGLRFDEVGKIRVEHISVTSTDVVITIEEAIKNSTIEKKYMLEEWPGNSDLRHSLYMDPFVAIFTWLQMPGPAPGQLFCDNSDTRVGVKLNPSKSLSSVKFVAF